MGGVNLNGTLQLDNTRVSSASTSFAQMIMRNETETSARTVPSVTTSVMHREDREE